MPPELGAGLHAGRRRVAHTKRNRDQEYRDKNSVVHHPLLHTKPRCRKGASLHASRLQNQLSCRIPQSACRRTVGSRFGSCCSRFICSTAFDSWRLTRTSISASCTKGDCLPLSDSTRPRLTSGREP